MSYAHAAALPGIQSPKPLSGHPHLRPGHDGRQTYASLRPTLAVWAGGNRPRHGWVSGGDVAESVLGTLQECGPPFHSSLPCQIQLSARCLARGPDLGGCAEFGTGLVSGNVSQCLYLSLLSLVSSLSISLTISISLFLFISLAVHLCFTLYLLLFMSVFYLLLSFQYVFFSLHLSHFVFILILCVPVSLPLSLLWVFLSAFLCPGTW